jgi:hypothetical protein
MESRDGIDEVAGTGQAEAGPGWQEEDEDDEEGGIPTKGPVMPHCLRARAGPTGLYVGLAGEKNIGDTDEADGSRRTEIP